MEEKEPLNYLTAENGVLISHCTSQIANCACRNVLLPEKRAIWLSDQGLPQSFIVNMSNQIKRPVFYKCFGFYCWHDYPSNPSIIELLASTDGKNFITWTVIHAELRAGVQLFQIDPLATRYNFLKIVIKETFGASKTYLNQIFLFEENPLNNLPNIESSDPVSLAESQQNSQAKHKLNSEYKQYTKEIHQGGPTSHSKKGSWGNSNLDPRFSQQPQRQMHPEQIELRDKLSPPHVARKPKLDDGSLSMTQPNFENQTGNFFSPTQEIYFSNTNLSLINETEPQQQHIDVQQPNFKNSPSFFDNPHLGFHNRNPSNTNSLNYSQFNSNVKQQNHIMPSSNERPQHIRHTLQPINTQAFNVPGSSAKKQSQYTPLFNENITTTSNKEQVSTYREKEQTNRGGKVTRTGASPRDNSVPLLTRSEKDLKEMKREMEQWGSAIVSLQDNMNKLVEKVSNIMDNIEHPKLTVPEETKRDDKSEETMRPSAHNLNKSQTLGDYLEDFKKNITVYLDSVINQNQTIIEENHKLRQNLDTLVQNTKTGKDFHGVSSPQAQTNTSYTNQGIDQRELEKIVNSLFERNMRSWENIFYNHIKAQNELLEDRMSHKFNNIVEALKDQEETFKRKVLEEVTNTQDRTQLTGQDFNKASTIPKSGIQTSNEFKKYASREKSDLNSFTRMASDAPLNVSITQRQGTRNDENSRETGYEKRTQKVNQGVRASDKAIANNMQKVQFLMDQLQEKIAIRDKKVQELQQDFSISSPGKYFEDFTSSTYFNDSRLYPNFELEDLIEKKIDF